MLAANPGAPLRPIAQAASGGELSRVMLAVQVVLAGADPVPTMVFDEVDAGVGGAAAIEVGRRLQPLSDPHPGDRRDPPGPGRGVRRPAAGGHEGLRRVGDRVVGRRSWRARSGCASCRGCSPGWPTRRRPGRTPASCLDLAHQRVAARDSRRSRAPGAIVWWPMGAPQTTKHVFVTGGVASSLGQGADGLLPGQPAQGPRPAGDDAEAGSLPQRGSRDDEPVPARRGVRHRRRRRDRPRRRALRAVPRHRPARLGQRHHRAGLLHGHRQGAPRRVPRRHRPGDPAHHQRDQAADPRDGRARRRRGHHRGRRHGRRHREPAVPGVRAPDPPRGRPRQHVRPARLAAALHRALRRAEDQADPALGGGAALDRPAARRDRPARRPRGARRGSSARSR